MLEFRLLTADEIECRIATVNAKGISLLLYKDARCDVRILNETVGAMNWQKSYTRDNANCTVSIWDDEKKMWVSKEDTGTPSNTEQIKGLASDSFKRACFSWGLGIELYTAPFIWLPARDLSTLEERSGKWTCRDAFTVTDISYTPDRKIDSVTLINEKTGKAHSFTNRKKSAKPLEADTPNRFSKEWLKENGSKTITARECIRLREACEKAGEKMSLENALKACRKETPEQITYTQYVALMANLQAVA